MGGQDIRQFWLPFVHKVIVTTDAMRKKYYVFFTNARENIGRVTQPRPCMFLRGPPFGAYKKT